MGQSKQKDPSLTGKTEQFKGDPADDYTASIKIGTESQTTLTANICAMTLEFNSSATTCRTLETDETK
uniref:Uncharacterized protein n=1 Tax=Onchocerca volvulus TaxID=6282 RepID=A0A8R1Y3A3_ONCVO